MEQNSRERHLAAVRSLDRAKVIKAVDLLKRCFSDQEQDLRPYVAAATKDPDWWIRCHHWEMRYVRNKLRTNSMGEEFFSVDNLDDYAVGLVELAWGITQLPEEADIASDGGPWAVGDMLRVTAAPPPTEETRQQRVNRWMNERADEADRRIYS